MRLRPNALDIWLAGRIVDFSDERAGGWDSSNALRVFYLGADYILSPSLLVGVVAQYDSMRMRSDADSTDIEGDGWMVGPMRR